MTTSTPRHPRHDATALRARPSAEVLIIGGGINGLATFRDLALQGVDVALVDAGDFVGGASAASSHMIHGGIRYLENGEFRLVREAVRERNALLRLAPHYVRPLQTTIPIYSTFSGLLSAPLRFFRHGEGKRTERGAALIKAGLVIYDAFSGASGGRRRHSFHGRRRSLADMPALNPALKYTATYWDASVHDPERLAIDVLEDGRAAGGDNARAVNYTAAVGSHEGTVVLRDQLTGEEFELEASVVVNASGPWTDLTNDALGEPTQFMGGTKGSHIVLDNPQLREATRGRELFFEHSDGRIVLIYPLKGRVLVGTTDLEHDVREPAVCTEAEVDYFLELIGDVFPGIPVDRSHIVYRYSGVRPLPRHEDETPGFVSRDYRIELQALPGTGVPVLSLVGGKWTTFRAVAEDLADRALAQLRRKRRVSTRAIPIGGGDGFPRTVAARDSWAREHGAGVDSARVVQLLSRYGTRAASVLQDIAADDDDAPLQKLPAYTTGELRHLARAEHVVHLEDLLLRRTSIAFTGGATLDAITEVAGAVAEACGWDRTREREEVARAIAAVTAAIPGGDIEALTGGAAADAIT